MDSSHAFWTWASLLTELAGFQARALDRTATGCVLTFGAREVGQPGPRELVVHARRGAAERGELAHEGLALRYEIRGEARAELGPVLSSWLGELARAWPALEALPSSVSGLGAGRGAFAGWHLARTEHMDASTLYEIGSALTEERALFELRHRERELRAKHRTPAPLATQEALRVVLATVLGAVSAPIEVEGKPTRHSLEVLGGGSDEVRLVLNAPCSQRCAFCSIPDTFLPSDGGAAELEAHCALLEARYRGGLRRLRLTGVDPLASSFVLDLVRFATKLGYDEVVINSPCTRLADRGYAEALVAALPRKRSIIVPLYALDAEIHDRVVGRPGAYALVRRALDHAFELLDRRDLRLSTVLTPDVLGAIGPLARFARDERLALNLYLPFPDADSPLDRFHRVTMRQEDVARALLACDALSFEDVFRVRGLAPCVVLRALSGVRRLRARLWLRGLRGRAHTTDGARTAHDDCIHRARCSLRPPCDGTILRAYAKRHGTREFSPA